MEFEKLKEIILGVINIEPSLVTPEASFIDDLGADSLDLFQIITGIEEAFQIEIGNNEIERIITVGDASNQIKNAGRGK